MWTFRNGYVLWEAQIGFQEKWIWKLLAKKDWCTVHKSTRATLNNEWKWQGSEIEKEEMHEEICMQTPSVITSKHDTTTTISLPSKLISGSSRTSYCIISKSLQSQS